MHTGKTANTLFIFLEKLNFMSWVNSLQDDLKVQYLTIGCLSNSHSKQTGGSISPEKLLLTVNAVGLFDQLAVQSEIQTGSLERRRGHAAYTASTGDSNQDRPVLAS